MAIGNICTNFGHVVFEICQQTDRQTYRHIHTDTLIAILRPATGGHFHVNLA